MIVAAGCDRRPDLARSHRGRKVPGGDEQARPDRLFQDEQRPLPPGSTVLATVDAHGLLREPAEELGCVLDFGARIVDGASPSRVSSNSARSSRRSVSSSYVRRWTPPRPSASWAAPPAAREGEILRRTYELLTERLDDLALLMTLEMGKPVDDSRAEIK